VVEQYLRVAFCSLNYLSQSKKSSIILFSALVGMGACLLWTAEGLYATRVSRAVDAYRDSSQQQKHNQQQEPGTTSTQWEKQHEDKYFIKYHNANMTVVISILLF